MSQLFPYIEIPACTHFSGYPLEFNEFFLGLVSILTQGFLFLFCFFKFIQSFLFNPVNKPRNTPKTQKKNLPVFFQLVVRERCVFDDAWCIDGGVCRINIAEDSGRMDEIMLCCSLDIFWVFDPKRMKFNVLVCACRPELLRSSPALRQWRNLHEHRARQIPLRLSTGILGPELSNRWAFVHVLCNISSFYHFTPNGSVMLTKTIITMGVIWKAKS